MEVFSTELIKVIVPAIGTAISLLVTWGLYELRKLIKTKTDSQAAMRAFDLLTDLVQTTVVSINQETVQAMKKGGESLANDIGKSLKQKARSIVMAQISAGTKKVLESNLQDLEVFVDNRIEQCVFYEKGSLGRL